MQEFFKKHNKALMFLISNVVLSLFFLIFLHFLNFIDINIFIRFRFFILIILFLSSFVFFLFFENQEKEKKEVLKRVLKKTFPTILAVQVLNSLNFFFTDISFLSIFNRYGYLVFGLFLVFSFALIWTHREESFNEKKDINKNTAVIVLLIILAIFTLVKIPHFETTFTGEHRMKYNSHVENALYMYERNNPFWAQRKYQANPFENPQGIIDSFAIPPLNEWGLYITYSLFPNNSVEFNTRLFTHFVGVLILLSAYVFFTKWLTKKESLVLVFLIAMNPIINLTSFVTVEDSWLILFTFLSLIYLTKYLKTRHFKYLFWCALLFGLGNVMKISILLWLAPIIFVTLALSSKKLSTFIRDFTTILIISVLPILAFKTSLTNLPSETTLSILKFLIWIGIFIATFFVFKKHEKTFENLLEIFIQKRKIFISTTILFLIIIALILNFAGFGSSFKEFLTDTTLLFNWEMYRYMLTEQFKNYMTTYIFYFGLIGFIFTILLKNKKRKFLMISFLLGSMTYWILASKSMFFHNYYTNIIMVTFCLGAGFLTYFVSKIYKQQIFSTIILLLTLFILFPLTYNTNTAKLSAEYNIGLIEISDFLKGKNFKEDELFLRPGNVHSVSSIITLYSGIPSFTQEKLLDFKDDSLSKYNVRYVLVHRNEGLHELNRIINANSFDILAEQVKRSELIKRRLEGSPSETKKQVEIIYRLEEQLIYIETINDIHIYEVLQ